MKNLTRTSKYISLILRHKPETIGITLDPHGWASVEQLLAGTGISMEELEEIVATDEKQRYSFNSSKTLIRANQGHSVDVDLELVEKQPPDLLYHGTTGQFLGAIQREGLQRQSRQYVHLSADVETAVKVGRRRGKPVVLQVRAGQMFGDGYAFYQSVNGVWLTREVPVQYLGNL